MPPQIQQQRIQQLGPPPRMSQGPQGLVTQPPPQQMIPQQAPFQFPPPGVPPGMHPQMTPHYSYPPPFGRAGATGPIPPGMIQPPANLAPQWEKPTTVEQNYFDQSRQQSQQQQQQRSNRSRSPTPGVQSPRNRSSKSPQPRQDQAHSGDFSNKYNKDMDSRGGYKHSRFVNSFKLYLLKQNHEFI
jgi:hypothetical protein